MDTQNKTVPLIIGSLFIILVIIAGITGYVYFKRKSQNLTSQTQAKTSAIQGISDTTTIKNTASNIDSDQLLAAATNQDTTTQKLNLNTSSEEKGGVTTSQSNLSQIPKTGISFILFPIITSGLAAGYFIKKSAKIE